jgi:hypothetical protein
LGGSQTRPIAVSVSSAGKPSLTGQKTRGALASGARRVGFGAIILIETRLSCRVRRIMESQRLVELKKVERDLVDALQRSIKHVVEYSLDGHEIIREVQKTRDDIAALQRRLYYVRRLIRKLEWLGETAET